MRVLFLRLLCIITALFLFPRCGGSNSTTYSLLADGEIFDQNTEGVNTKIDILWVIDNSGSMENSQVNLTENFQSFIQGFQDQGFDFQMGVTTTDAYFAQFTGDETPAELRDGLDSTSHTGFKIITSATPNITDVFLINAMQGTNGDGDERGLQSFQNALNSPLNSGFLREDSFLAVIIVSDEDDISRDSAPRGSIGTLHTVQSYVDYLDDLTGSVPTDRKYNVSAMTILDDTCKELLNQLWAGHKIGSRYIEISEATDGLQGSLCGDFATDLELISKNILRLATQFYLKRVPIVESVLVVVDGVEVPHAPNNPSGNGGWSYNPEANSIIFSGDFIPAQGAQILINYDPIQFDG